LSSSDTNDDCFGFVWVQTKSSLVIAQNGETVLAIANLMADSESGSPSSYSHFIVNIDLSRLVLEIFVCDRQTERQTMQTITIAGPHIVEGQLKKMLSKGIQKLELESKKYANISQGQRSKVPRHF